jgi:hypothetical protein
MKERPVLFSGPMVRAILDGRKTQTRRVVKDARGAFWDHAGWRPIVEGGQFVRWDDVDDAHEAAVHGAPRPDCPYGMPGDRLWVRETWQMFDPHPDGDLAAVGAERLARGRRAPWDGVTGGRPIEWTTAYQADGEVEHPTDGPARWRPSIHMPRWASRLLLDVTDVRVQRLHGIDEGDAIAEGVDAVTLADVPRQGTLCRRDDFGHLWDLINGKRAPWASNPWVWAVTFRRVQP